MDDREFYKKYEELCKKAHSHLDAPLTGTIYTPICKVCLNVDMHYGEFMVDPECLIYGEPPEEYIDAEKNDCPHFKKDPNTEFKSYTKEDKAAHEKTSLHLLHIYYCYNHHRPSTQWQDGCAGRT